MNCKRGSVSGGIFGLWAGGRGQESCPSASGSSEPGREREVCGTAGEGPLGSYVPPSLTLWPGWRRPSCSLTHPNLDPPPPAARGAPHPHNCHSRDNIPHLLQKHHYEQVILDDGFLIYKRCISLGVEQKGNHLMAPLFSSMNTF